MVLAIEPELDVLAKTRAVVVSSSFGIADSLNNQKGGFQVVKMM